MVAESFFVNEAEPWFQSFIKFSYRLNVLVKKIKFLGSDSSAERGGYAAIMKLFENIYSSVP